MVTLFKWRYCKGMNDLEPHNYLALTVRRLLAMREEIDLVLHWAVIAYAGDITEAEKILNADTNPEAVRAYLAQFDTPMSLADILNGSGDLPESAPITAEPTHFLGWCQNVAIRASRLSEELVVDALQVDRLSKDLMRTSTGAMKKLYE